MIGLVAMVYAKAIIPCPTNMVSVHVSTTAEILKLFSPERNNGDPREDFKRKLAFVFNKTIIPLALVGYEMIIAKSELRSSHIQQARVE